MFLNLGSIEFNASVATGGNTPSWGTEMGQGEGYKFSFESIPDFFSAMVYNAIDDLEHRVWCPLGKGGNKQDDYQYVIASLFEKVYVNGLLVEGGNFVLLIVKLLNGEHHVGRRTLKYNPNITLDDKKVNQNCFRLMAQTLGLTNEATWFISEINLKNQDELHFAAHVLDAEKSVEYPSVASRKDAFLSLIKLDKRDVARHKMMNSVASEVLPKYRPYITAIKSKPFLLLAGISGTGKSRIVRELARACWEVGSEEYEAHKPKNFEMVQVKPNWHDSSELIGYVSRINGEQFVVGPFLRFMVKAMQDPTHPYFLCLDEMNLAPVEQYFAEFLSVIESRKQEDGIVVTDPIVDYEPTEAYMSLINQLFVDDSERAEYLKADDGKRLTIPQNLIVVGTVNMDETTFSFSRKVLDRAMTIEMNEVDLDGGLTDKYEIIGKLGIEDLVGTKVEGIDVYADNKEVCDKAINYLKAVNAVLEGTPFKVAYRTRNEFLLYVVNNLPYRKDDKGNELTEGEVIARALDEITSMKVLSRIEGDDSKVSADWLSSLAATIKKGLDEISGRSYVAYINKVESEDEELQSSLSVSLAKLEEMKKRLESGYTSFWS